MEGLEEAHRHLDLFHVYEPNIDAACPKHRCSKSHGGIAVHFHNHHGP